MTKKLKIGISLVILCAVLVVAVCFLLPGGVKITADLTQLEPRSAQYGPVEETEVGIDSLNYNSPNSNWWLNQWTGRDGMIAPLSASDDSGYSYVAVDEDAKRIEIVCQSYQGDVTLLLKGFQSTSLGTLSKVKVTVESVRASGELGTVYHTTLRQTYTAGTEKNTFRVELKDAALEDAYHIVISPTGTQEIETTQNKRLPQRYEAEDAAYTGGASVVKAKLGNQAYVTGIEGDSALTFRVKAPETGTYQLNFIYAANGRDEAGALLYASQLLLADGEQVAKLNYPPTGSDNVFSNHSVTLELEKGIHELTLRQASGSGAAIDCMDFTLLNSMQEEAPAQTYQGIPSFRQASETNAVFLLPVAANGYYDLTFYTSVSKEETAVCKIEGTETSVLKLDNMGEVSTCVYLQKGLNFVELPHNENNLITGLTAVAANISDEKSTSLPMNETPAFNGNAEMQTADNPAKTECAGGITVSADSVAYRVSAPSAGTYKLTFSYAAEGAGEASVLGLGLRVNGQELGQQKCESTLSSILFRQKTLTVELGEGENTLTFYGADESGSPFRITGVQVLLKCLDKAEE